MSSDLFLENQEDGDFLSISKKAKELVKEVDWVGTQRKVEYLDKLLVLSDHSSIQTRRKVAETLAILANKDKLSIVTKWQEKEADRKTWLILEGLKDKLERTDLDGSLVDNTKIFSVSEALFYIKQSLGKKVFMIEGEVGEVQNTNGGRIYFISLKGGEEEILRAMTFDFVLDRLGFPLNEGLMVRASGSFKISKKGGLYFDIQKLELTGEGEFLRNLKLLENKLKKEGLFDIERKRKIKILPQNILLIASPNSAAIDDFLKIINQRRKGLTIHYLPIKTQGIGAEREILERLSEVNNLIEKLNIDTITTTRGGGSKEDLMVFNSEKVVRAIFSLNKPVIVAIGHERDITLAELVADLRCSTPSQAAEKISQSSSETIDQISKICHFLESKNSLKISEYRAFSSQTINNICLFLSSEINLVQKICHTLDHIMLSSLNDIKTEVRNIYQNLIISLKSRLDIDNSILQRVSFLAEKIFQEVKNNKEDIQRNYKNIEILTNRKLLEIKSNLTIFSQNIEVYDPKKVLEMGYALVLQKDKSGGQWQVREKISGLSKETKIKIKMVDGEKEFDFK